MTATAQVLEASTIPDHVPASRVVNFDYLRDARLLHDPFGTLAELQATSHNLVWTTGNTGHWIALSRDIYLEIMQNPDVFSNMHINIPPMEYRAIRLVPEELDPPEHTKYRRLLNPVLSPRVVGNLEENTRIMAREMIAAVVDKGEADIMEALTVPLPCKIFMSLLGLPIDDLAKFLQWKDDFLFADDRDNALKQAAIANIVGSIRHLIAKRRAEPAADIMSELVSAQVDGRPINDEELLSMGFLLFLAGLDTVTSAMTNCVAYLAFNADRRDELIANPALVREAIEEMLRRFAVVNPVRTAMRDIAIDGVTIRKGEQVLCSTILANLDGAAFESPLSVEFDRVDNPHLTFGGGPHRCVGSHLARIEVKVVLEEILASLSNFRIKPGHVPHYHAANLIGLKSLPIVWDVN